MPLRGEQHAWQRERGARSCEVATGSGDYRLRVVDAASGEVAREVLLPGLVWPVAWSPDGRRIAAGTDDSHLARAGFAESPASFAGSRW